MTITRARLRRRTAQTTPLLLALLLPAPATATTYQALCGNNPCTINLDMNGIGGQNTFIPIGRIAKWYTGGEEGYDSTNGTVGAVGGGTAGAIAGGILLGPVGLVGGMVGGALAGSKAGKTADLYFSVVGYDSSGDKTTLNFRFVNPRPANRMKQELPMFTGLAMGETRSLADLQRHRDPLPQRLGGGPSPQSIPSQSYGAPSRYR
ncbi:MULTISPECIES: hypothetical protein [unclassified Cyanobium]|uniref:hypothetical protein n=1 Tax=unclassified Cyanobium TaxID=2627006 RepID=UPI0020CD1082|nr:MULTISPECIES: hypothetical protein [unclassified Cyanobium]MCP9859010.1 hypothetical protein [Cyanobium sp. Cruz-8H5]MCP9866246.1 hypothetical protein [Cyanobium sp. Cruz-8D1]